MTSRALQRLSRAASSVLHPDLGSMGRSVGIAILVGIAGGLAAVAFELLIELVRDHGVAPWTGLHHEGLGASGSFSPWVVLVPAVGGLAVGWLIWKYAPEAEGHGTEAVIRSFHRQGGFVRRRIIGVKALASALTIGTGGSAGQEGPVAQVGSGIGSSISDAFKLSERDRRIFLLSGASAGIGAMFSAPLGGALFAPEVLYRKPEFEGDAIIPCIISSILAYTTRTSLVPGSHAITIQPGTLENLAFHGAGELLFYLALGIGCAVVSWIYVAVFNGVHRGFAKLTRVPRWVRPGIGGLLLGFLALAIAPVGGQAGVLFGGYRLMESSIEAGPGLQVLFVLIFAKILATSLSIGSGGSGGLFAPSLAIGALIGATVAKASNALFEVSLDPACFALVGMGGFFAGVAKTPIAAVIIVCEMTGSYTLLAPLMLVAVVHMLLATRWTIYDAQVEGLVESPAHAGEFVVDVLERLKVEDVRDRERVPTLVSQNATLRKALEIVSTSAGSYFPVVDQDERLVGIFSLSDVRRIFRETGVEDLVIVRDFMVDRVATVRPGETLNDALRRLNEHSIHEIPVVSEADPTKVIGMLSRNNLGAAYHRHLQELRQAPLIRS